MLKEDEDHHVAVGWRWENPFFAGALDSMTYFSVAS
jgi:hypothetical protein